VIRVTPNNILSTSYPFLFNKYFTWYFNIIKKAKQENRKKNHLISYEVHHIYPRSFSKINNKDIDNSKENLILLTEKEHYVCHWLLIKSVKEKYKSKMIYAFWRMNNKEEKRIGTRSYKISRDQRNEIERKRMIEKYSDPKEREAQSILMKKEFTENPERRDKISKGNKENWNTTNRREAVSNIHKRRYEDPNERKKTSDSVNKAYKEKGDEIKLKLREASDDRWAREGEREKQSTIQLSLWSDERKVKYGEDRTGGKNHQAKKVKVTNIIDGEEIVFDCQKDLYAYLKVSEYLFTKKLKNGMYENYKIEKMNE
jgi:hypothetical protein